MSNRRPQEGIPAGITAHAQPILPEWIEPLGSSLLMWVDDSTLATDISGGVVTTWTDKSGNGNSPTQATGSKKPAGFATGGPNNRGYIQTDGVDDFLRKTFTLTQPAFVFLVAQKVGATQDNPRFLDGATANTMDLYMQGTAPGSNVQVYLTAAAGNTLISPVGTLTNWNRIEGQWNGASSKVKIGDGAYTTGSISNSSPGGIILGCWGDQASAPVQARYSMVIVANAIPSAGAIASIQAYASNRYGV